MALYSGSTKICPIIQKGITPTGTINITENGIVDVTNYASANVSVSGGGGDYTIITANDFFFMDDEGTSVYQYNATDASVKLVFDSNGILVNAYFITDYDGHPASALVFCDTNGYEYILGILVESTLISDEYASVVIAGIDVTTGNEVYDSGASIEWTAP